MSQSTAKKTDWIRTTPQVSILIMNPENMYHWMSLKVTVEREIHEDDPNEGEWVTQQLNRAFGRSTSARTMATSCAIRHSTNVACYSSVRSTVSQRSAFWLIEVHATCHDCNRGWVYRRVDCRLSTARCRARRYDI